MKINKDELKQLAELSKLKFTDEELDLLCDDFSKILKHFDLINTMDFSNVDLRPKTEGQSVLRKDKCLPFEDRTHLFDNVFEKDGTFVKVPKVMD